ncbi:hypothetical protein D6833_02830, partial [Candidatus Parcubacteria bacterium]
MAKSNPGESGIKTLAIQHGEKAALIIVIVLAGVFFAMGYRVDSISDGKTPASLLQLAKRGEEHVNREEAWDVIKEDRVQEEDYPERVQRGRLPVQVANYPVPLPWTPDIRFQKERRSDPELFPPTQPEVSGVYAAVAYRPNPDERDLLSLEPLALRDKEAAKKQQRTRARSTPEEEEEEEEIEEEGPGSDAKYLVLSENLHNKIIDYYQNLFHVPGATRSDTVVTKGRFVVAVKATVPWEKQWREFRNKLETAMGYSPERDVPRYYAFEAERAEVKPDGTEQPAGRLVAHTWSEYIRAQQWVATPEEICDPYYKDPALTMPIPPLLMCNYGPLALHSDVPMRK